MKLLTTAKLLLSALVLAKAVGATNMVLRIDCGSETPLTDNDGNGWSGDKEFAYGDSEIQSYCSSPPLEISDTDLDIVYCSRRFFTLLGGYKIPVDAGVYNVKLMFAEVAYNAPDMSVFDVRIQNQDVAVDLDVFKKYGFLKAGRIEKEVSISTLPNEKGMIEISLQSQAYRPFLNGIVIERIRDAPIYQPVPYRINAGYTRGTITDSNNKEWSPDKYFRGGNKFGFSTCENMIDPKLYCTERSAGSFSYKIPIKPGDRYDVHLHFAEFVHKNAGKRVFSVTVQGKQVVVNLDLIATVGYRKPHIVMVENIFVKESDPWITIEMKSSINNAKISGIYINHYVGNGRLDAPVRINTGASVDWTDPTSSVVWQADNYYTGGNMYVVDDSRCLDKIDGTTLDKLACDDRFSHFGFTYFIPMKPGEYTVRLLFVYIVPVATTFDVIIQNDVVLQNLDTVALVGFDAALVTSHPATVNPSDQGIYIEFIPKSLFATINAIEIVESGPGSLGLIAVPP